MTLEEVVAELPLYAKNNPYKPRGGLTVEDNRYKRLIEIEGQTVEVTLALLVFGPREMYQLDIKTKDTSGRHVHSSVAYKIKAALLDTATELGDKEERRRYVLAAN